MNRQRSLRFKSVVLGLVLCVTCCGTAQAVNWWKVARYGTLVVGIVATAGVGTATGGAGYALAGGEIALAGVSYACADRQAAPPIGAAGGGGGFVTEVVGKPVTVTPFGDAFLAANFLHFPPGPEWDGAENVRQALNRQTDALNVFAAGARDDVDDLTFVSNLHSLAACMEDVADELDHAGLGDQVLASEDIRRGHEQVVTVGLPEFEVDYLQRSGFDDEALEEFWQAHDETALFDFGPITVSDLLRVGASSMREEADLLIIAGLGLEEALP